MPAERNQAKFSSRPSATELASAGRQVWERISDRLGRGESSIEVTVLFTELSGFSSWVLEVGDEQALELLREVAAAVEPCITAHGGQLVKRLGHGHMAVFPEATEALGAAIAMQETVDALPGAHPQLQAGLHRGRPQRLGGDYLGADVNIAARISEAAKAGEVLASDVVLASIRADERERLEIKRRRAFRAKGTPPGLEVFCVAPRQPG